MARPDRPGGSSQFGVGRMRDRITLMAPERTRKASGQTTLEFTDQETIWAEVRALSGTELYQARQVRPDIGYEVTIRARLDVQADWRIRWGARVLDIAAVIPGGTTHGALRLVCSEVSTQ